MRLSRRSLLAASAAALAPRARAAEAAGPTLVERLGAVVAGARAEALSAEVMRRLTLTVADNFATLVLTTAMSARDPYLARLREAGGRPEARIWGADLALPYEDAAAAYAFLIHYAETDDSDFRAELRASPTVMGPALALAHAPGLTGADLAAAIAAGYSVLGGLAAPLGPLQDDGFMSAGVWGPSAAAAVAARLLRLTPGQSAHAMALAAGAGGGAFQYFYDQTEEKRLVVARAARAGVEAALLAARGETGPRQIYEGRAGLYRIFGGEAGAKVDTAAVAAAVARLDGPLYVYPKFFAASSSINPTLEALAVAMQSGLAPGQVERFTLRADPQRAAVVAPKVADFEAPGTLIGAKLNYAFMVAFLLVRGAADGLAVDERAIRDPQVLALAGKARFEPAPGAAPTLLLHLKSGQVREITPRVPPRGQPAAEEAELRALKIRGLTAGALDERGRARLTELAGAAFEGPLAPWTRACDGFFAAARRAGR